MGCDFVFGAQICIAASKVYYLKEYVSFYRKTDVSISRTTARSTTAAAVLAYDFLKSLKLDRSLESTRALALKRVVPIVVSVYARNHQPMQGLSIVLAHLYAYNYGLSKRLYFHLMLILKGFAMRKAIKAAPKTAETGRLKPGFKPSPGFTVSTGGQMTRPGYSLLLGIANICLGYWWDTYPFQTRDPRRRLLASLSVIAR